MTQLQKEPGLVLSTVSKTTWEGESVLTPIPFTSESPPFRPGKKVGDLLVDSHQILVSVGDAEKLGNRQIRKAGISAGKWLIEQQVPEVGLAVEAFVEMPVGALAAFCEGLLFGAFQFDNHKSNEAKVQQIRVAVLKGVGDHETAEIIRRTTAIMRGVNLAREWSHEPPNVINPVSLAERVQLLAAENNLLCAVFGEEELIQMGAGAILSVGLGSKTPSQMILLEHPGVDPGATPVVIAGKAITFDTGGYSLKSTQGMLGMKYDKCGGMDVAGILQAVATLNLPTRVIGIIAAAENMISSDAYRPNDIITSLSGKTIEIVSTDAEGRMVLSDALTYASTKLDPHPRAIIDLATLTGGVVTALGEVRAGLMTTDDNLAAALTAAGERTGEWLWRLPLDEEYFELIRGRDSDLRNSAGKPQASAIVGGTFLKQFVRNDLPWAHLDIAGMATTEKGIGGSATGFGVRLVLDYLVNLV
jgi:leucyl aminopeptidase